GRGWGWRRRWGRSWRWGWGWGWRRRRGWSWRGRRGWSWHRRWGWSWHRRWGCRRGCRLQCDLLRNQVVARAAVRSGDREIFGSSSRAPKEIADGARKVVATAGVREARARSQRRWQIDYYSFARGAFLHGECAEH